MGKVIAWLVILGLLCGGAWYGMYLMNKDTGYLVGYAIGQPDENNQVQLQILTPNSMVLLDGPPITPEGHEDWPQWMKDHYTLKDSAGTEYTLDRIGRTSGDIRQTVADKANAEFICGTRIPAGGQYTLDVSPVLAEGKKYTLTFTAEPTEYKRVNFLPNY